MSASAAPPDSNGGGGKGEGDGKPNPFTRYYAQLLHQQNMLQDSVRTGGRMNGWMHAC